MSKPVKMNKTVEDGTVQPGPRQGDFATRSPSMSQSDVMREMAAKRATDERRRPG